MGEETVRSRIRKVLRGEMPEDRLPHIEWATWWDKTLDRWRAEGLPGDLHGAALMGHFGLDPHLQHWFWGNDGHAKPLREGPMVYVETHDDYDRIRDHLYHVWPNPDWASWASRQAVGDVAVWCTFNGFFWWPRVLFGIEGHLYAFYDEPELMHRMCADQADYCLRCIEAMAQVCVPDFMTFAEDMSYNHGPMLSKAQFDEFLLPYYGRVIPRLKELGVKVLVDSDGDVSPLIPWLIDAGVEGILPLERMAGVDVPALRQTHPDFLFVGGFDKTTMHLGEAAMRAEFDRLLPAMRAGRFIPSVDHQTPPEVSLADYRLYLQLLEEVTAEAVR